ncbi:hypothetical protein INT43_003953, partial [Umbelopsis isabellina]
LLYVVKIANLLNVESETPLPDNMRSSTLLEQIGHERSWTSQQMDSDIAILVHNRLYFVKDLRVLSAESWKTINLLPIVKDLLQKAINVGIESEYDRRKREKYERKASYDKHEKNEKNEKSEKKDKKDKKKKKDKQKDFDSLGDKVISSEKSEDVPYGVTSDDPTTLRNTLQNSSTSLTGANGVQGNGEDEELSPKSPSEKMVSFDSQPSIIDHTSKKEVFESDSSNSSDSDSMSESSSSDDNKPLTRVSDNSAVRTTMPLRKIKAVGSKIHVLTTSGQAYECERYCPHKGVDLVTWGQVVGNSLVCTKHNWNFALDKGGANNKGSKSLHACKINDW